MVGAQVKHVLRCFGGLESEHSVPGRTEPPRQECNDLSLAISNHNGIALQQLKWGREHEGIWVAAAEREEGSGFNGHSSWLAGKLTSKHDSLFPLPHNKATPSLPDKAPYTLCIVSNPNRNSRHQQLPRII